MSSTAADFISQCTVETCSVQEYGSYTYIPTLAGNGVYLAIFVVLLAAQGVQSIYYKIFDGFVIGIALGCITEIIGYIGRLLEGTGNGIFNKNYFIMQLVCLTIAPAFITASIYLSLGRIIQVYGSGFSRVRPSMYAITFVTFDVISLVLQAIGGAIASTADTQTDQDMGVNIMIAGLAFQVFSLVVFMIAAADVIFRVKSQRSTRNVLFEDLQRRFVFKGFLWGLGAATILITIRCIYRVVELSGGFGSAAANNEPAFMVLDGPMVFIAVGLLTLFHPGLSFAGRWKEANFRMGRKPALKSGSQEIQMLEEAH